LNVRVPASLRAMVEKEAQESETSNAAVVISALRARYGIGDNGCYQNDNTASHATDNGMGVEVFNFLKEQIETKDARIAALEGANSAYISRMASLAEQRMALYEPRRGRWAALRYAVTGR